jgi:hypothetical protein
MDAYVQEVRKLENKSSGLEVHHVIREYNVGADILSKLGSTRAQVQEAIFCDRTNLNYTGSSALILSRKAVRTQLHFKLCNPVVCQVKSR